MSQDFSSSGKVFGERSASVVHQPTDRTPDRHPNQTARQTNRKFELPDPCTRCWRTHNRQDNDAGGTMKSLAPAAVALAALLFSGCSASELLNTGGDTKCKDFITQDGKKQNQSPKCSKTRAALNRRTWRSRPHDCRRRPIAKRWESRTPRSLKRHTAEVLKCRRSAGLTSGRAARPRRIFQ